LAIPRFGTVFHAVTHGDYFNADFVRQYWVPYIAYGRIDGTEWEKVRTNPPWWLSVIALLPVRWLWWVPVSTVLWVAWRFGGGFL
jgi:hypothetical protein